MTQCDNQGALRFLLDVIVVEEVALADSSLRSAAVVPEAAEPVLPSLPGPIICSSSYL